MLRLPQVAGSLAFLTLFAIVPIATIGLAVFAALPAFSRLREVLQTFLAANLFLPHFSEAVVGHVNTFASKAGGLSVIGLAVFLATSVTVLLTIEKTLNAIWRGAPQRTWLARLGLYWTVLTLAPPLLGASLALDSYFWTVSLSVARGLRGVQRWWGSILPWLLLVGALMSLYKLLPSEKVRWRHAAIGALAAATTMQLWKAALGYYVSRFPTYAVVYGAFAALPAFLLWLYLVWLTVLFGALVAAESRFWGRPWHDEPVPAPARQFDAARRALAAIAEAAGPDGPGWVPAGRLAPVFDGQPALARSTAELLEANGYIRRLVSPMWRSGPLDVWDECWVLAQPPSRLTLRRLFEAIWQGRPQHETEVVARGAPSDEELDAVLLVPEQRSSVGQLIGRSGSRQEST